MFNASAAIAMFWFLVSLANFTGNFTGNFGSGVAPIPIFPGTGIQAVVDANPAGTSFLLKTGVHRLQSVAPKNNDTFTGETGTIMSGASVLTPVAEGPYWVVTGQTQRGQINGFCASGYPRCDHPEDLYIDNVFLIPVDLLANVVPGKWFFDYTASKIYMADNPTGHVVETTVARSAFSGSATGVRITGLTVEKYAIPAQMGAIGDQFPGDNWIIDRNEVRWNHGAGIYVSNGGVVSNNNVHHNGELGMGGHGVNVLVTTNEIASNNTAGFDVAWEAGGTKFALTNGLTIKNNNSHDNAGLGFWTDTDNINTVYDGNTITNNREGGISHEISYAAIFKNNVIKNNGPATCSWLFGGQIQLQNSQNAEIFNNRLVISATGCGNGITLVQQSRGSGAYGPYVTINNYVHNNSITHLGSVGASGGVEDFTTPDIFDSANNNRFDFDNYHMSNPTTQTAWAWSNNFRDWTGFQSFGLEAHGTVDSVLVP